MMMVNKMLDIGIFGFRDKRHIIYSILKILGDVGRTIFITQNPCYIQLSENFSMEFEINDIDVIVSKDSFLDIYELIELDEYDFCIWDCITEIPTKVNLAVLADHGSIYREAFEELIEKPCNIFAVKEEVKKNEIPIVFIKASSVEDVLTKIEKDRILYSIPNNVHNKSISSMLSKATGISQRKLLETLKPKKGKFL